VEAYRAISLINDVAPRRLNVNTCLNVFNLDQIEELAEKILGFSHTTAHCLCLPEWDGNALANRDKMCRLAAVKERLAHCSVREFPLTILDNVPYCIAPHLPHIGNCRDEVRIKRGESDAMVSNADNMGHNRLPVVCREMGCPRLEACVGVDRNYLDTYGEDELRSVLSAITPPPVDGY
jgi:hypothetical protein